MKRTVALSERALGPYSPAVLSGDTLYISGQIPLTDDGAVIDDIEEATRRVLQTIGRLLENAGYSFKDVVKTTVFLRDMNDFAKMNGVYESFFEAPYPARSTAEVRALPKNAPIEIDAIAQK